jgi:homoserine O-acetyltransferase
MGGMQALEWTVRFPNRVKHCILTATCGAHSAMQIGFNEVGRQAIIRDPNFSGGDYYESKPPDQGLSVARMLGHLSFLSQEAFEAKFGRRLQNKTTPDMNFGIEFEVESYLNYQGDKFTKRFDANSLLHLTRAIDYYEFQNAERAEADYLVISYTSDWIYPTSQSIALETQLIEAGKNVTRHEIDLPYGHDAFLLDGDQQAVLIKEFLER